MINDELQLDLIIKSLLALKGKNIADYSKHTKTSRQNIYQKINRNSISVLEFVDLCNWLGFNLGVYDDDMKTVLTIKK